jgi:hypothetical protein
MRLNRISVSGRDDPWTEVPDKLSDLEFDRGQLWARKAIAADISCKLSASMSSFQQSC